MLHKLLILIFFGIALSSCSKEETVAPKSNTNTNDTTGTVTTHTGPYRIMTLGDSYTIGQSVSASDRYPAQLVSKLNSKGYTFNAPKIIAQTGWTTDDLAYFIEISGDSSKYDFVFLLIGVNDQYEGATFSNYKPKFTMLLKTALRYANNKPKNVFVISIPDYAYTPYGQGTSNPSNISSDIDLYNSVNKAVSDSCKVNYINITPISRMGINSPSLVASDGLHPSGQQYALWVDEILKKLTPMLSKD